LKYVNDPKQKFSLALQSGKLEEAMAAADILKEKIYYEKLAEKAMGVGKLNVIFNFKIFLLFFFLNVLTNSQNLFIKRFY